MTDSHTNKEAIEWFVRVRSDQATASDRTEFDTWLAASPQHQEAYDLVVGRWNSLAVLGNDPAVTGVPGMSAADQNVEHEMAADAKANRANRANKANKANKVSDKRESQPASNIRLARLVRYWALATAATVLLGITTTWLMLDPGDTYRSAVGEQRRVLLEDGSSIHLNTDTEVRVRFSNQRREVLLSRGEVLCDVAKAPDRPFVVVAGQTEVIAIGTKFSVFRRPQNTQVIVVEGRVAVEADRPGNAAGAAGRSRQMVVQSGQRLKIKQDTGRLETLASAIEPAPPLAWDQGLLVFDGAPLDEVVEEIDRYFHGKLRVGSDVPTDTRVTGTFKLQDRSVLLDALSQSLSLSVVQVQDTTLLVSSVERLKQMTPNGG